LCASMIIAIVIGNIHTSRILAADLSGDDSEWFWEVSPTPAADTPGAPVITSAPVTASTPTPEPAATPTPASVTATPTSAPATVEPTVATVEPTKAAATGIPAKSESSLAIGAALTQSAVSGKEAQNPLNSTIPLLLYDLTEGTVLASNQATDKITPNRISEMMTVLVALQNLNSDLMITVSETAVANAAALSSSTLSGFEAGDVISMKNLVLCYLMTGSDDARMVLVETIASTEGKFVSMMNSAAKSIGMKNSKYVSSDGSYNASQYTTVYDMCVLVRELLTYSLFAGNCGSASINVSYTKIDGTTASIKCRNKDAGYSQIYGGENIPSGFTQLMEISGGIQATGLSQFVVVKSSDGSLYIAGIGSLPFEKDVSLETERLLEVILGNTYYDKEQVLPLGDDTVRYQYLLGTDVVYYTVDNKAPGYATESQAAQYMMTISVPVWQIDSNGNKVSTTYSITMNRKLITSIRKIFNEIYALDIQFPIKVMKGYGYRQSGGSGLSNCTFMSMHSYGAALDINYGDYDNDYYLGAGNDLRDMTNPYCIPQSVIDIFEANGWYWGGDFGICVDSMHFEYLGLEYLTYQGNDPFDTLSTDSENPMKGYKIENLQDRLKELGFSVNTDGVYSSRTKQAVIKFQTKNGLEATGVVDYKTWETLINLTHYMSYVF